MSTRQLSPIQAPCRPTRTVVLHRDGVLRTLDVITHRGIAGPFEMWGDPQGEIELYPSEWVGSLGWEVVA